MSSEHGVTHDIFLSSFGRYLIFYANAKACFLMLFFNIACCGSASHILSMESMVKSD